MQNRRAILVITACLIWTVNVAARDIRFSSSTVLDGLSLNTVTALILDRHGFLWVGTLDGLNRYDGEQFEVFRFDRDDPTSLPADKINALQRDREGRLWVATDGGLARFDEQLHAFVRHPDYNERISRLLTLDDGNMVVASKTRGIQLIGLGGGADSLRSPFIQATLKALDDWTEKQKSRR